MWQLNLKIVQTLRICIFSMQKTLNVHFNLTKIKSLQFLLFSHLHNIKQHEFVSLFLSWPSSLLECWPFFSMGLAYHVGHLPRCLLPKVSFSRLFFRITCPNTFVILSACIVFSLNCSRIDWYFYTGYSQQSMSIVIFIKVHFLYV